MCLPKALENTIPGRTGIRKGYISRYGYSTEININVPPVTNILEHDFFQAQIVQHPRVFLLKQIIHDWGDSYAVRILRELRKAAEPVITSPSNSSVAQSGTELLLIDCIIPYICDDAAASSSANIPGLPKSTAPVPLLPHFADTDPSPFYTDLSVRCIFSN